MTLYVMLLGTRGPHGIPVPGYVVQTDDGAAFSKVKAGGFVPPAF